MTIEDKRQQTAGQYGDAAASGLLAGAATGGMLIGRRGVAPGALVGALATVAGRHSIQSRVSKLQDKGKEIKAGIVGSIPGLVSTGIGAGALIGGRHIGKIAKKSGEFMRQPGIGKVTKMRPQDYTHVVMEPKPIAGLLKRFSERHVLDHIIQLATHVRQAPTIRRVAIVKKPQPHDPRDVMHALALAGNPLPLASATTRLQSALRQIIEFKIKINPENEGKFTATEEKTGKTTEELKHSKNPLTRKRATFAQNARSWALHRREEKSMSAELRDIIEFKAVDLGYTYPDYGPMTSPGPSKKVNYPSLYIDDRENEIDLPLTGTAKVKFKLRSKTTRQDEEGKKRHSASIEIQSIDPDEPEPVKPGAATPLKVLQSELSDIIQFGARKKIPLRKKGPQSPVMDTVPGDMPGATTTMSERNELRAILQFAADPRPRNRLGEFDGGDGGPNQMAIHATYRQGLAEGAIAGAGAIKGGQALAKLMKKARRA